MRVEGKEGPQAPRPINIPISDEQLKAVKNFAEYEARRNNWNMRSCYIGAMGESAFGRLLHRELGLVRTVNFRIFDGGDGGVDITIAGFKIQIKTSTYDLCRVQVQDKHHRLIPQPSDAFLFCHFDEPFNVVRLLGWIRIEEWERLGRHEQPFPPAAHKLIDRKHLEPIGRLLLLLSAKIELERV